MSSWEIFWSYVDTLTAHGIGGFSLFSLPHFLWLAFLFLLIIAYIFVYHRGEEKTRDNMRKVLGLFLILFEIFKQCVMALTGAPTNVHLPLEICSFGEYAIILDAMWPKNRIMKQVLLLEFLPAAVIAIMLPSAIVYPPLNIYVAHQFIMHGGIIAYVVARYHAGEIELKYVGIWMSAIASLAEMVPIYFVDTTFRLNYMFLTSHADNPVLKMLWDVSGGNGGIPYVMVLAAFVLLVMHVWYLGCVLIRKLRQKGEKGGTKHERKDEKRI